MEKLRELMKEHQDKADKKVMGEVLELLQREPGLFVVTVHATKNFFLGAENGKAAAFLYTSREYADEFVKGLEMVGVETKVLEIRPLQRISFFNDLIFDSVTGCPQFYQCFCDCFIDCFC